MAPKLPRIIDRILVIRMSSIGDILLITPVLRQLRHRFADARIDVLTAAEYADLLSANPHVDTVLTWDRNAEGNERRRLRAHIRDTRYDVVLDLHRSLRSIRLLAGLPRLPVLKFRKHRLARFFLVHFKWNLYPKRSGRVRSVPERYLLAGAPLGLDPDDRALELHLPESAERAARERWEGFERDGYRVVIAPGARHFTKRWPAERYARLVSDLYRTMGWRCLLVGGPEEVDVAEAIRVAVPDAGPVNLAGSLSLTETMALIRHAAVFVSNDSGLMHAAAAARIPQVALFGSPSL